MSLPALPPNTDLSGSREQGDNKLSMLNPFLYDTSPLPDRLLAKAMSATTYTSSTTMMTAAATATTTKGKPSEDNLVKDLEKTQEITAKL